MRIIPLIVVGLSALALSACDGPGRKQKAEAGADCCCKVCPTRPEAKTAAAEPASGKLIEEDDVVAGAPAATPRQSRARGQARSGGHRVVRYASRGEGGGYRRRSSTEGVGYLDEEPVSDYAGAYRRADGGDYSYGGSAGGYRREDYRREEYGRDDRGRGGYRGGVRRGVEVEIDERETFSERRSSSESSYAYGSSSGGYGYSEGSHDGRRGGRRGHKRRHGGGYAGLDRDGYLTWPGKTP